jgi:hypothetical protein
VGDGLEFPHGAYALWADDDVIGLTVAKTYPQGWPIVRVNPPLMDAFDEFDVGQFLARCLSHHHEITKAMGWDE